MASLLLIWILLLDATFSHSEETGSAVSPSSEGDTRMGADAATTGTDITDKELQEMEERGNIHDIQGPPKKEDPLEEERAHTNVK